MNDEVKAALRAAVDGFHAPFARALVDAALHGRGEMVVSGETHRQCVCAAVAAFLRALPGEFGCCKYVGDAIEIAGCGDMQELAAAVEASAHD